MHVLRSLLACGVLFRPRQKCKGVHKALFTALDTQITAAHALSDIADAKEQLAHVWDLFTHGVEAVFGMDGGEPDDVRQPSFFLCFVLPIVLLKRSLLTQNTHSFFPR